jgi:predicted AAA+ superfamily ATPase
MGDSLAGRFFQFRLHPLDIKENIRNIKAIATLIELLKHRVGSPVSYNSLARDLEKDPKTIKRTTF